MNVSPPSLLAVPHIIPAGPPRHRSRAAPLLALGALWFGLGLTMGCSPDASAPAEGISSDASTDDAGATDLDTTDGDASSDTGPGYWRGDITSSDVAPWPDASDTSLPSCTRWSDAWSLPDLKVAKLKGPKGSLALSASSDLQPIGVEETVTVRLLDPKGKADSDAEGTLKVSPSAGVEVISVQSVMAGKADVIVRVTKPGAQLLKITASDGRAGQIRLWGYTSQLPIWRIDVDPADFATLKANPLEYIWVPATLIIDGVKRTGKMRLHGGSSRTFKKQSLRLNLDKNQLMPDGRRKLVLRAEYIDKTLLRSYLAYEMLHHSTWLPASNVQYVHLRLNATYHGVMIQPDRIDKVFLAEQGLNPKGSLYEADPPSSKAVPGGNLTVADDPKDYPLLYQQHEGNLNYTDLIELIEVVLQLPDAEFAANIDRVVKVDDVLVFLALAAVIQNQDWVKKNYYLYRDPFAADARWSIIPWDLDLSFGRLWTEKNDIFEEQIFIDGDPYVGMNKGHAYYNQLVDRLLESKALRKRFRSFVAKILGEQFEDSFLLPRINNALCRMQPDLLADRKKRGKNTELLSRVQEIRDFLTGRRTWLKTWLSEPDPLGDKDGIGASGESGGK